METLDGTNLDARHSRRFGIVMPICKALPDTVRPGGFRLIAVGSDEKRDMEGEIVKVALARPDVLAYLIRCGVLDYNHIPDQIIGKVNNALMMDASMARMRGYTEIVPPAMEIDSRVHPLPPMDLRGDHTGGLEKTHFFIESQHPLFASAYGAGVKVGQGSNAIGETGTVVVPALLSRVAITPQPVNMNAACTVMAKSLSQMFDELAEGDSRNVVGIRNGVARELGDMPDLVYMTPEVGDTARFNAAVRGVESALAIEKSLVMTGVPAIANPNSADALKVEGGSASSTRRRCHHCACELSKGKYCHECGSEQDDRKQVEKEIALSKIKKSAYPINSEFLDALMPKPPVRDARIDALIARLK